MRFLKLFLLAAIVTFLFSVPNITAQTIPSTSTISGQVTDASGNGMAGVVVAAVGDRSGTQIALTDTGGNYSLPNYGSNHRITLLASKSGYIFNPLSIIFVSSSFLTGNLNASFTGTFLPIPLLATPILLTEENSLRALALDSITLLREPFPVVALNNFSSDKRSRIVLFAVNAELQQGESISVVTAKAEDSSNGSYNLPVESLRKVPGYDWLRQVVLKLPDGIGNAGEVSVSITVRGSVSNKVLVKVLP